MKKRGLLLILLLIFIVSSFSVFGAAGDVYICKTEKPFTCIPGVVMCVGEGDCGLAPATATMVPSCEKIDDYGFSTAPFGSQIRCYPGKIPSTTTTTWVCCDEGGCGDCDVEEGACGNTPNFCGIDISLISDDYCLCDTNKVYKKTDGGYCVSNVFTATKPPEICTTSKDEDGDGEGQCGDDECDRKTCASEKICFDGNCIDDPTGIPEFSLPTALITLVTCLTIITFILKKK